MITGQGHRRKLLLKIFICSMFLAVLADYLGLYLLSYAMIPCIGRDFAVRIMSTVAYLVFDYGVITEPWHSLMRLAGSAMFDVVAVFFVLKSVLGCYFKRFFFLGAPALAILSQAPRFLAIFALYEWLIPMSASGTCQVAAIFSPLVFTYAWLSVMAVALRSYVVHYHPELIRPRS